MVTAVEAVIGETKTNRVSDRGQNQRRASVKRQRHRDKRYETCDEERTMLPHGAGGDRRCTDRYHKHVPVLPEFVRAERYCAAKKLNPAAHLFNSAVGRRQTAWAAFISRQQAPRGLGCYSCAVRSRRRRPDQRDARLLKVGRAALRAERALAR